MTKILPNFVLSDKVSKWKLPVFKGPVKLEFIEH